MEGDGQWTQRWTTPPLGPGTFVFTAEHQTDVTIKVDDQEGPRTNVYHCRPGDLLALDIRLAPGSTAGLEIAFTRPLEETSGQEEAGIPATDRQGSNRRGDGSRRSRVKKYATRRRPRGNPGDREKERGGEKEEEVTQGRPLIELLPEIEKYLQSFGEGEPDVR